MESAFFEQLHFRIFSQHVNLTNLRNRFPPQSEVPTGQKNRDHGPNSTEHPYQTK